MTTDLYLRQQESAQSMGIIPGRHRVRASCLTLLAALVLSEGHAASAWQGPVSTNIARSDNRMLSPLISFNWSEDGDFGYYTDINTDHGDMGDSSHLPLHGYELNKNGSGLWEVWAKQDSTGTSWHGRWISLVGTSGEKKLTIDLKDPMPRQILLPFRVRVTGVRVRVKGVGTWKLELKRADESHAIAPIPRSTTSPNEFVDDVVDLPASLYGRVKLLNIVVESQPGDGSHLWFDSVDLVCDVPDILRDDPLMYGAAVTYSRLLSCLNEDGTTKDHLNFPGGDFDSVPAMGFQIYAAACASDLGVISKDTARDIATRCTNRLLKIKRHSRSKLLPHFLEDRRPHPDAEYSSVDTALALVPAVLALDGLGMESRLNDVFARLVDPIDWDSFTNRKNELTHGFDSSGEPLSSTWTEWNSELITLLLLRALKDPSLPPASYACVPEPYCGRAFLYEMAGLWASEFGTPGKDRCNVDWSKLRRRHLSNQKAFTTSKLWWGLDPVEIIRWKDGKTTYLEAGVGTTSSACDPVFTAPGYGSDPWFAPHYTFGLVAPLDPNAVGQRIEMLLDDQDANLFPPLGGPVESVQVRVASNPATPLQWHRVSTSINLFFTFAGLYAGVCSRDDGTNIIHQAAEENTRIRAAVRAIYGPRAGT